MNRTPEDSTAEHSVSSHATGQKSWSDRSAQEDLARKYGLKLNKEGNIVLHESPLNALTLVTITVLSIVIGIWGTLEFPWSVQRDVIGKIGGFEVALPLPLFLLPSFVLIATLVRAIGNIRMVFCPEYLIYVSGVVSWKSRSIRVDYQNIREIETDQTLYQKAINLGDIVILIVSTQIESSLNMPGLRNPKAIKDYLREKIQLARDAQVSAAAET